ncbi:hypothetical protein [Chryseobacterium sp. ISL-6]|uniref:hypothetical protein n=1 Tax=Chryseobacterium sp. ISL-6 TaxID=2819143 RepID=UPI001BE81CE9|nr:hypothetical protein [Chryseobacterium sp. ISL-6]MBT2622511.1 hypothetical protein [Chryseobacterium sp. ISL-6]
MSINAKSPDSYFFTSSSFINNKAFGSINQNEFQITTGVAGNLPAYAVADGFLFFAKYGETIDKVNIILKPKKDIGVGLKIKYFVYRGINASDLFKDVNGSRQLNDPTILSFLTNVWDSYTEFNGTNENLTVDKIGYLNVSTDPASEIIKKFFIKDGYNLLEVKGGTHIGNFINGFGGFEIVLDEGEFSQTKSDTGLDFNLDFATATSCILKADQDHPSNPNNPEIKIFGGKKNNNINSKIFKENIYKFIDPASFYGLHITNEKDGIVNLKNGNISTPYKIPSDIYNNFVSKFINKNKIYIYIKSDRNRSYKFYKPDTEKNIYRSNNINNSTSWGNELFKNEHNWPLIVKTSDVGIYGLYFSGGLPSHISSNILLQEIKPNTLLQYEPRSGYLLQSPQYFKFLFNDYVIDNNVSQLIYIDFFEKSGNVLNDFFGPINLETIFEDADFTPSNKISWISHLRPIIIEKGIDLGVYNMKGIIDKTDPSNLKQLRTYMLLPKASNIPADSFYELKYPPYLSAGYYNTAIEKKTSKDFCKNVMGVEDGEIWRGEFNDGSEKIKSLVFRSDANIFTLDYFILGITQKNYADLISRVFPTGSNLYNTNLFIDFGANESVDPKSFGKYEIQIKYDDEQGNVVLTTTPSPDKKIYLYTIDEMFFFTKDYTDSFEYYDEFANTTVDFRPENNWMRLYTYTGSNALDTRYSDKNVLYGFDWLRKGDSQITPDPDPIYEIYDKSLFSLIGEGDSSDPNSSSGFLLKPHLYIKAKGLYKIIPTNWKLAAITAADYDKDYAPSWLSIPNITGVNVITKFKINLKVSCFKKPTALRLYFDIGYFKMLKIDNGSVVPIVKSDEKGRKYISINSANVNSFKWLTLEIENIKPLEKTSIITAEADGLLAGKLYILPNDSKLTQKQKTVFINVKTDAGIRNLHPFDDENLGIFSSHANIKIEKYTDSLNVSITDYLYSDKTVNTEDKINGKTIFEYLSDFKTQYHGYVKIFLMIDPCRGDTVLSRIGGSTIEEKKIALIFDPILDNTRTAIAHEFFHAIGVEHTFTGYEIDKKALISLKQTLTNNLMDYHNDEFMLNQFIQGTFFWQWIIARRNTLKN